MRDTPTTTPDETADVVVVGAGPAGIAAATSAAESGAGVILLDEGARPGGQIWRHRDADDLGGEARRRLGRWHRSGARLVSDVAVFDVTARRQARGYDLWAARGDEPMRIAAGTVVLATGARELFLPFPGWTLPNVLGAGAMQALIKGGLAVEGQRVLVAGSGPLLLAVGALLVQRGAEAIEIAEQTPTTSLAAYAAGLWRTPGRLLQAAAYRRRLGLRRYRTGSWVTRAEGRDRVERATVTDGRRTWSHPCDWLCVGFGLVPNIELAAVLGCEVKGDSVMVDHHQGTSVPGVYCAGEPTGIGGMELALVEGEIAGRAAAGCREHPDRLIRRRDRLRRHATRMQAAFALRDELRGLPDRDTLVCRCEDVPLGALDPAWTPRQAKLYTRCGMGPCQGRVCGPAMTYLRGWPRDTLRPPAVTVTLQAIARMAVSHEPDRGSR